VSSFNKVKELPYVQDVTIFGQALHVAIPTELPVSILISDLSDLGVSIQNHRSIQPSLEDVFVTLTKTNIALEEERYRQAHPELSADGNHWDSDFSRDA